MDGGGEKRRENTAFPELSAAMTIGNGAIAPGSANQTRGQFISALAQEVPDPDLLMRIVDRVPVGVAIVRGSELRYTLVNASYAAIPPTPGCILGRSVTEVFPSMPAATLALLEKVYTTGETFSVRGHQAGTDLGHGPTFWDVDFIALPETEGGGLEGERDAGAEKGVLII